MMADEKPVNAPTKRKQQILRWDNSETNLASALPRSDNKRVKFQDGCVFLAACSSGDREEVKNLLDRGADINTANVDGLTALHQACIDDNLDMVEFLVEHGADVDVCDNEGWTPLHATSSCAFTEIARYLLKHGANVAAVNNDGDLPYDIAENKGMEVLLQDEMNSQGIDADAARCEEEERMLEDANEILSDSSIKEVVHPKTGATALHVAAAKGYLKVMKVLLRANVDINGEDFDGWTPLHAAAHWGQEEACKLLVENFCDMMHKNNAGHTAFDLAEKDMHKLLEELKETQASMKEKQEIDKDIILSSVHGRTRRSSVTRMSGDQKQNIIQRNSEEERAALAALHPNKDNNRGGEDKIMNSISSSPDEGDTTSADIAETERKNEKNKQVSQQTPSSSSSWSRPASVCTSNPTVEPRKPDMPKIDEVSEVDRDRPPSAPPSLEDAELSPSSLSTSVTPSPTVVDSQAPAASISKPADIISSITSVNNVSTDTTSTTTTSTTSSSETPDSQDQSRGPGLGLGRDLVSRSISVPARLPTQKDLSSSSMSSMGTTTTTTTTTPTTSSSSSLPPSTTSTTTTSSSEPSASSRSDLSVLSLRQGLRKTGSTSMVHQQMSGADGKPLPRSASSPRLALERGDSLQDRLSSRRPLSSTGSVATTGSTSSTTPSTTDLDSKPGDRNSYTFGTRSSIYGSRTSNYVPYQTRQQREAAAASAGGGGGGTLPDSTATRGVEDRLSSLDSSSSRRDRFSSSASSSSSPGAPSPSTPASTSLTSNTNSVLRRSYEPPKRDEETETQRKARAKHARQTRRSTQGVSLDDIEKAEQVLKSNDAAKLARDAAANVSSLTSTSTSANSEKDSNHIGGSTIPTATTTTTTSSSSLYSPSVTATTATSISSTAPSSTTSPAIGGDSGSLRGGDQTVTSAYSRRRGLEDREKSDTPSDVPSNTRSSYRRLREDRDTLSSSLSSSSDLTSNYIPRSQRNSSYLSSSDGGSLGSSSQGVVRSTSMRSSRLRNGDSSDLITPRSTEDDSSRKDRDDTSQGKEERKEMHAVRLKRQRKERRSTGIVYDNVDETDGSKDRNDEKDEDKKEEALAPSSRYSSRYSSNSDVPTSYERSQRPSSYSDVSRSTGSLDLDYKKKYEDEKTENERLRKELEETKASLRKAKEELDIAIKLKDSQRNTERDKRALERKLSEMEEELKDFQQKTEALKSDNQRLKEENGALIRVISKLSK